MYKKVLQNIKENSNIEDKSTEKQDINGEEIEKGEISNAIKGAVLALGIGTGSYYMNHGGQQTAAKEFSNPDKPQYSTSVSNNNSTQKMQEDAYKQAREESQSIIKRNDKKYFLQNHAEGLSPHVYRQTIKNNPDLSTKYGYTSKFSKPTFREVIQKNPNLRQDISSAHYDKLYNEFQGNHDKINYAWSHGIKATRAKFKNTTPSQPKETQPKSPTFGTNVNDFNKNK